jgi:hypothetical protein
MLFQLKVLVYYVVGEIEFVVPKKNMKSFATSVKKSSSTTWNM